MFGLALLLLMFGSSGVSVPHEELSRLGALQVESQQLMELSQSVCTCACFFDVFIVIYATFVGASATDQGQASRV